MLARAVDVVLLPSCRVAKDEDVAAVRALTFDDHAPVLVAGPGAALSADRRVSATMIVYSREQWGSTGAPGGYRT